MFWLFMGLWVFMLFLHVCCIVALSGGLGSIGVYGLDQFDYVLWCKFKQVPLRGKDSKVREFSFKSIFLRFCRKQKRFYNRREAFKLLHAGSGDSCAGNMSFPEEPRFKLNLSLGEFCWVKISHDNKSSFCQFEFNGTAGVFSRFVDAVRQGRHVKYPCAALPKDVYHGGSLDGSVKEIAGGSLSGEKEGHYKEEQQGYIPSYFGDFFSQIEGGEKAKTSSGEYKNNDAKEDSNKHLPICYRWNTAEPGAEKISLKEIAIDLLFLPKRFLTVLFWILRTLWYLVILHDFVFLPLLFLFFLYIAGFGWWDCPTGPPPHGYAFPVSWYEFLADWNHFLDTGRITGLLRTCLFFYLLLVSVEFFLPAVLATFVRTTGRWIRSVLPLTYLDCLGFCCILVPLLIEYAVVAWFAVSMSMNYVFDLGQLLMWAFVFVFYTVLFPYRCRVYHWHNELWWRFAGF